MSAETIPSEVATDLDCIRWYVECLDAVAFKRRAVAGLAEAEGSYNAAMKRLADRSTRPAEPAAPVAEAGEVERRWIGVVPSGLGGPATLTRLERVAEIWRDQGLSVTEWVPATTIARLSEALAEAERKGAEEAERQSAYYGALVLCLDRYEEMASKAHLDRLVEFITEFHEAISDRAPLCKLNRWLGYIQGTLISEEVTSVEAERDWTRRLFRSLDFPAPPRDLSQGGQHG